MLLSILTTLAVLAHSSPSLAAPVDDTSDMADYTTPPMNISSLAIGASAGEWGHCTPGELYCFDEIIYDMRTYILLFP